MTSSALIRGVAPAPGFHGVRAVETTDQTASSGDAVTFNDADAFDTDGYHDTSTNTSRLTVPAGLDGYYLVESSIRPDDAAGTYVQTFIAKNGTNIPGTESIVTVSSNYWKLQSSIVVYLVPGDYVQLIFAHGAGGTKVIRHSFSTGVFGMTYLGSAGAAAVPPTNIIYDSTLGADAASFDVTSIPATYRNLLLELQGRGTKSAEAVPVLLRMNNDSGANYHWEDVYGVDTAVAGAAVVGTTSIQIGALAAASAPASYSGMLSARIGNYAGTTFFKNCIAQYTHSRNTAANKQVLEHGGGIWLSAAAINRLTIYPDTDNFLAGTRLTVYGI